MASLHLPCCPSSKTPYFFSVQNHQITHKLSALYNHSNKYTFSTNNSFSLSRSLPLSLYAFPIRNNKLSHFILHLSSTTENPVADSSSLDNVLTESQSKSDDEEEFLKTRLLASNVPWDYPVEDIRALFEKFGTVVDVELSMHNKTRNRGLAFVTMGSHDEAAAAISNLESHEFGGRTLKLNYAKPKKEKPSPPAPTKPGPTFNLFVANLPFDAKSKDLKEFFIAEGANIVSAEIIFHDSPRRSSGYGFVAFKTKKEAEAALAIFSEKVFRGRQLRVARSKPFVKQPKEVGSQSDSSLGESEAEKEQAVTANVK